MKDLDLLVFYIFLVLGGIAATGYGIWVALHLKNLPTFPVWIGCGVTTFLTLKAGQLLGEIINILRGE